MMFFNPWTIKIIITHRSLQILFHNWKKSGHDVSQYLEVYRLFSFTFPLSSSYYHRIKLILSTSKNILQSQEHESISTSTNSSTLMQITANPLKLYLSFRNEKTGWIQHSQEMGNILEIFYTNKFFTLLTFLFLMKTK